MQLTQRRLQFIISHRACSSKTRTRGVADGVSGWASQRLKRVAPVLRAFGGALLRGHGTDH